LALACVRGSRTTCLPSHSRVQSLLSLGTPSSPCNSTYLGNFTIFHSRRRPSLLLWKIQASTPTTQNAFPSLHLTPLSVLAPARLYRTHLGLAKLDSLHSQPVCRHAPGLSRVFYRPSSHIKVRFQNHTFISHHLTFSAQATLEMPPSPAPKCIVQHVSRSNDPIARILPAKADAQLFALGLATHRPRGTRI
jgi:hypothetical protein